MMAGRYPAPIFPCDCEDCLLNRNHWKIGRTLARLVPRSVAIGRGIIAQPTEFRSF